MNKAPTVRSPTSSRWTPRNWSSGLPPGTTSRTSRRWTNPVWANAHGFTLDELAWIQPDYFPLYVNWCRDRPPLDLAATTLGPDSCDTSTVTSVCADTCGDGISVFAPIVWEGDEPVTATFELFGDRAVEATLEPGVPQWLGPLVVNEREVEWIRGEVRAGDCIANISDTHDYNQGEEMEPEFADCETCGCQSTAGPTMLVHGLLMGVVTVLFRRRGHLNGLQR